MGKLRSWLYRCIYPLPEQGQDSLAYKESLIDEYTQPYQLDVEIKLNLFSGFIKSEDKREKYIKSCKDREQRAHIEAYKVWHKITSRGR